MLECSGRGRGFEDSASLPTFTYWRKLHAISWVEQGPRQLTSGLALAIGLLRTLLASLKDRRCLCRSHPHCSCRRHLHRSLYPVFGRRVSSAGRARPSLEAILATKVHQGVVARPTLRISLPADELMVTLLYKPQTTSSPAVPLRVSSPDVPTIVQSLGATE